jgi:hypothetical protein
MVGLLKFQLYRAAALAGIILLSAGVACWAQTPEEVFANASASHPMSAWIAVPIGIGVLIAIIALCAKFVRNDPCADAAMRGEAGDRPITPIPDGTGHIHFH